MPILATSFNNKNQFRRYPIKQDASMTSDDGFILQNDVIVNCSITSVYGKHKIYIRQIFRNGTQISVAIASCADNQTLGYFNGELSDSDFTVLQLSSFVENVAGTMTVGMTAALESVARTLNFSAAGTELEESTIFCYRPPAVTSIRDKKNSELRGHVNFGTLTNLSKFTVREVDNKRTEFTATNPASVFNLADKSSYLGNCKHRPIYTINGVYPFPDGGASPDNDGNIYIAGILPIIFYGIPLPNGESDPGIIAVDTGSINLDTLCTQRHKLLPPADVSMFTLPPNAENDNGDFINRYYNKPALEEIVNDNNEVIRPARAAGSLATAARPEYFFWPQFVQDEYYQNFWPSPIENQ